MNADFLINGSDLQQFANCVMTGGGAGCGCADVNGDTVVNNNDIANMVFILMVGQTTCPPPAASDYEPGSLETPPAATCNETRCGSRPDEAAIRSTHLFSGEFHHSVVDLRIEGRGLDVVWARKYRSRYGQNTDIGNGWDYSYNIKLEMVGEDLLLYDGNNRIERYPLQPDGITWARDEFFREIRQNGDGTYTLTFADNGKWNFNPIDGFPLNFGQGKIKEIVDRNGNNKIQFTYDSMTPTGRLKTITDTLNRNIEILYNANGRISTVTDHGGRQVVYTYYGSSDPGGNLYDLKSVRSPVVIGTPNGNDYPLGKTTEYTYSKGFINEPSNHNLLTIKDPRGQVWLTNSYHPTTNTGDLNFDRLTRQVWGNQGPGAALTDAVDVVYVQLTPDGANNNSNIKAIVNDRVGNVRESFYNSNNRLAMMHEYTGRADPDLPTSDSTNRPVNPVRPGTPPIGSADPLRYETRWAYNQDALPTSITYPNGNTTGNLYETDALFGGPNAPRRTRGNLRRVRRMPGPLGGDQAVINDNYTYEPGFGGCGCSMSFVKTHTNPRGFVTTHTYDLNGRGNRERTDYPTGGGREDWTYNAFGQLLTHTLPANANLSRRVDAYEYYDNTDFIQNGRLKSETINSTDPNADWRLKTTYTYDILGRVLTRTAPNGNAPTPTPNQDTQYTYTSLGQVVRERSRAVNGVRYETRRWYDANDNLVRVDRENRDETGALELNAHVTSIWEYDILNRLSRRCEEKGFFELTNDVVTCQDIEPFVFERLITEYSYDANGNQMQVRNPQVFAGVDPQPNDTLDTEYDERDLVFRTIRAKDDAMLKTTMQTNYDGNGSVMAVYTGIEADDDHVTTNTYDGYNRLKTTTNAIGTLTTYTYDANGNRVQELITGEKGPPAFGTGSLHQVTFTFNAMDRLTDSNISRFNIQTGATIGDGLSTTTTVFADNGQVASVTDDNGNTTTTDSDTANRRSLVTDALGNSALYNYDANSNVTSTVETEQSDPSPLRGSPEFFTTFYFYDGLDRRTATIDNIGNTVQQNYDSRDNVVETQDANGNVSSADFDTADRLTQETIDATWSGSPEDLTLTRSWDDDSRPLARSDPNNNPTTETFNARGESESTKFADNLMGCYTDPSRTYDGQGDLSSQTDANGTTVNYTYDLLNRVIEKSVVAFGPGVSSDTTFEIYQYDGLGRINQADDDDSTVTRTYDSLGNILTETQNALGSPVSVTCTYDGVGNKLTQVFSSRTVTMTYDGLNRLKTIGDNIIPLIASYNYIGPSRVQERECPANGTTCVYEYDGARRITRTTYRDTTTPGTSCAMDEDCPAGWVCDPLSGQCFEALDDRVYTWDGNSNKLSRQTRSVGGAGSYLHAFDYDAANRLRSTTISGDISRTTEYDLDRVGNRETISGSNVLEPGNYSMNVACDPGDFEMNQYTSAPMGGSSHDTNGNLLTSNAGMIDQCDAVYDYANRMVSSTVAGVPTFYRYDTFGRRIAKCADGTCAVGPTNSRCIYDGWREIQTLGGGPVSFFTYGVYIDEVLHMRRGGVNHFYIADDLYNVVALADVTGAVTDRYEYDDYGRPLDAALQPSPPAPLNPWLFNGRLYDPETGWYYYRTRYLDPRAGRFTTRDTIGIWGDEANVGNGSTYVGSNPFTHVDPLGLGPTAPGPIAPLPTTGADMAARGPDFFNAFLILHKWAVRNWNEMFQEANKKNAEELQSLFRDWYNSLRGTEKDSADEYISRIASPGNTAGAKEDAVKDLGNRLIFDRPFNPPATPRYQVKQTEFIEIGGRVGMVVGHIVDTHTNMTVPIRGDTRTGRYYPRYRWRVGWLGPELVPEE